MFIEITNAFIAKTHLEHIDQIVPKGNTRLKGANACNTIK